MARGPHQLLEALPHGLPPQDDLHDVERPGRSRPRRHERDRKLLRHEPGFLELALTAQHQDLDGRLGRSRREPVGRSGQPVDQPLLFELDQDGSDVPHRREHDDDDEPEHPDRRDRLRRPDEAQAQEVQPVRERDERAGDDELRVAAQGERRREVRRREESDEGGARGDLREEEPPCDRAPARAERPNDVRGEATRDWLPPSERGERERERER